VRLRIEQGAHLTAADSWSTLPAAPIDIQNDFLPPSGALAVPDARAILPAVRDLIGRPEGWTLVCASLDCRSFSS
jgi:hypothetical protein